MPYWLTHKLAFPPPETASPEGVVALGGAATPERLLLAYSQGIFPWPVEGLPLLWFSPDPRFILRFHEAHVGRSLARTIRRGTYQITTDTAFERVIALCAQASRPNQRGTWITPDLLAGYAELHRDGFAHSIEAWSNDDLVGGLYGVSLGSMFCGESMFALAPDASKVAFVALLGNLLTWGFSFIDCQVHTEHLARFGATAMPRAMFLSSLRDALTKPTRRGRWFFDLAPIEALAALLERSP